MIKIINTTGEKDGQRGKLGKGEEKETIWRETKRTGDSIDISREINSSLYFQSFQKI